MVLLSADKNLKTKRYSCYSRHVGFVKVCLQETAIPHKNPLQDCSGFILSLCVPVHVFACVHVCVYGGQHLSPLPLSVSLQFWTGSSLEVTNSTCPAASEMQGSACCHLSQCQACRCACPTQLFCGTGFQVLVFEQQSPYQLKHLASPQHYS